MDKKPSDYALRYLSREVVLLCSPDGIDLALRLLKDHGHGLILKYKDLSWVASWLCKKIGEEGDEPSFEDERYIYPSALQAALWLQTNCGVPADELNVNTLLGLHANLAHLIHAIHDAALESKSDID